MGSKLVSKGSQGYICIALASPIEGYQRTSYLFLFVIRFIPYNIYALLYSAPTHDYSSILPKRFNWLGEFVQLLISVLYIIAHYYCLMYSISVRFMIFI